MLKIIQRPGARILILIVLGLVVAVAATSQPATAATGLTLNRALLHDHRAEAAYKRLSSRPQTAKQYSAAFNKAQAMPVSQTLAPVKTWKPAANAQRLSIANNDLPPVSSWAPVGPTPLDTSTESVFTGTNYGPNGGRITAVVVNPYTSGATTQIYIGTMGGGIWKSINNGTSWTSLTDKLPVNMIGALAMDVANTNILYAGTGEGNLCLDCGYSNGLWKTINGGATWTPVDMGYFVSGPVNLTLTFTFEKIYANGLTVWAATNYGLYRSTNGGGIWNRIDIPAIDAFSGPSYVGDMAIYGTTLYVTSWDAYSGSNTAAGVYKSATSGSLNSWKDITPTALNTAGGVGLDRTQLGRSAIAFAPTSPNTLYLLASTLSGAFQGAFKSINGGISWSPIFQVGPAPALGTGYVGYPYLGSCVNPAGPGTSANCTPAAPAPFIAGGYTDPCSADGAYNNAGVLTGQCWYDIYAVVDPGNYNIVYFGGVDIAVSFNGGSTFSNITRVYGSNPGPVHPDQHGIAFSAATVNGKRVAYFGNDGGMYTSSNAGLTWTNLNSNLNTLEVYYTAGGTNFANQRVLWNGMQDNGTAKYTGNPVWQEMFGGDGGFTAIDPTDQRIAYEEYVFGQMNKTTDGGLTWVAATAGLPPIAPPGLIDSKAKANNSLFITPFIMDPHATSGTTYSQHLLLGEDSVYETLDGGTGHVLPQKDWCRISQVFSPNNLPVSALAIDPQTTTLGSQTMYAGMSGDLDTSTTPPTVINDMIYMGTSPYATTDSACGGTITNWTSLDPYVGTPPTHQLPDGYISDIAVDPNHSSIIYVTISAYGNASNYITGSPNQVWKGVNNAGTWTWTAIDAALPVTNVNSVIAYGSPNGTTLIVGSDVGVFMCKQADTTTCSSWTSLSTNGTVCTPSAFLSPCFTNGLPQSPVYKVRTDWANSTLIASLHGRGVWTMPIPQAVAAGDGRGDTVGLFHHGNDLGTSTGVADPVQFNLATSLSTAKATVVPTITPNYGMPSDTGLTGDWNGDGIATIGVYRNSTNQFLLKDSNAAGAPLQYVINFGMPGDIPLVGDWTHAGHDSVGVYRPSTAQFLLVTTMPAAPPPGTSPTPYNAVAGLTITFPTTIVTATTRPNFQPFVGDFNGDGYDTPGLLYTGPNITTTLPHFTTGTIYYTNTICTTPTPCAILAANVSNFLLFDYKANDKIFAGDWTHSGTDGIGIYRSSSLFFYLRNALASGGSWTADGGSDFAFMISSPSPAQPPSGLDDPVVGHYDTTGTTYYVAPKGTTPNNATPAPTQQTAPNYVPPAN